MQIKNICTNLKITTKTDDPKIHSKFYVSSNRAQSATFSNYKHQNLSEVKATILCKIQQQCLQLTKKKPKVKIQKYAAAGTHLFLSIVRETISSLKIVK